MNSTPTQSAHDPSRSVALALITGGSRGLGRSMALHLARRGVDSIVTYLSSPNEAESVVKAIRAEGRKAAALQLDVSDTRTFASFVRQLEEELKRTFQRKDVDALVNNAGRGHYAPFAETTEASFDEMVNVHFKSTFFLTQALLGHISNGGRILNITSGLDRFSYPGYATYASMKGAVEVLSRYLAVELAPRGISVNTVAPGAILTDFGGGAVRNNPQLAASIAAQTALGRVGEADDIGGAVAALLSSDARWINGQRIEIAGGIHL